MTARFPFFSREPRIRILHLSWIAFFISFVVWFNHAPLMAAISETLRLSKAQVSALLILNVALAIPARVGVGILVDKLGPRVMYAMLLAVSGLICFFFAFAQDFAALALARFLLGIAGAGFVVGIRIISEWFPARESGLAQGLYAGLGNFGSAAAAVSLPTLAMVVGGPDGWRWAIATTGFIALVYSVVYFFYVTDAPKGSTYFAPKKMGAMEVTSKADFLLYCVMQIPIPLTLAFIAWKLGQSNLQMLPFAAELACYFGAATLFAFQLLDTWRINKDVFSKPIAPPHRYRFTQVAVLGISYFTVFGSELAVISILPLLFKSQFGLSLAVAGFLGASFGMTAFFARPMGGWLSDRFGRKATLSILLAGSTLGYFGMSFMTSTLGVLFAVTVSVLCSLFVNATNGAVYAMLPMIKRRLTGQIAGLVGAFGNVGGVAFLALYSEVSATMFFLCAACGAALSFVLVLVFIVEPKGHITEQMPDGSLALIEVR